MGVIEKYARLKAEHKELKDALRKLVERIIDKADAHADSDHKRYTTYRDCVDEIEAVLNKNGVGDG